MINRMNADTEKTLREPGFRAPSTVANALLDITFLLHVLEAVTLKLVIAVQRV